VVAQSHHFDDKQDPDPRQSEKKDLDPHHRGRSDRDQHQNGKKVLDPPQGDADPQQWLTVQETVSITRVEEE